MSCQHSISLTEVLLNHFAIIRQTVALGGCSIYDSSSLVSLQSLILQQTNLKQLLEQRRLKSLKLSSFLWFEIRSTAITNRTPKILDSPPCPHFSVVFCKWSWLRFRMCISWCDQHVVICSEVVSGRTWMTSLIFLWSSTCSSSTVQKPFLSRGFDCFWSQSTNNPTSAK